MLPIPLNGFLSEGSEGKASGMNPDLFQFH